MTTAKNIKDCLPMVESVLIHKNGYFKFCLSKFETIAWLKICKGIFIYMDNYLYEFFITWVDYSLLMQFNFNVLSTSVQLTSDNSNLEGKSRKSRVFQRSNYKLLEIRG
jgi:hypothetical protein